MFLRSQRVPHSKNNKRRSRVNNQNKFAFSLTSKVQEPSAFHSESSKQVPRSRITSTRLQAEISKLAWPRRSHPVRSTRVYNVLAYFYADYFDAGTPAPWGKNESVGTHPEVIEQFDSFSLLKLFFRVRNWNCWSIVGIVGIGIVGHERFFLPKRHPKAEKKLRRRPYFDIADRHETLYGRSRLCASAQRLAVKLAVLFRCFESFL